MPSQDLFLQPRSPRCFVLVQQTACAITQQPLLSMQHAQPTAGSTIGKACTGSSAGCAYLMLDDLYLCYTFHPWFGLCTMTHSLSLPLAAPTTDSFCSFTDSLGWSSGHQTRQAQELAAADSSSSFFCWQQMCCWCLPLFVLLWCPPQRPGKQCLTDSCHAVYACKCSPCSAQAAPLPGILATPTTQPCCCDNLRHCTSQGLHG